MTRIEAAAPGTDAKQLIRQIMYDADPGQPSAGRFLEGRPAVVTEPDYTIRYSYNRAGKVIREEVTTDGVTLATSHEYNLQGRLTAITYPDGRRVTYTLDRSGVPTGIPGMAFQVSYEPDGTLSGYRLVNGIAISSLRDPVSRRLGEVAARKDGATLRRLGYGYDAIGNIVTIQDEMPGDAQFQTFGYDGLHRLTSYRIQRDDVDGALLRTGSYAYDAPGNLLHLDEVQPVTLGYEDAAHPGRLTSVTSATGAQPVSYDARGHTRSLADMASIEFDQLDRLVHVVKTDGTDLRFVYDPQNRRIVKRVEHDGVTSTIRYAAGLFERHDASVIRHIYLGSTLVASETVAAGGPGIPAVAYYLSDRHGTILLAMDAAGSVIMTQRYTPFGLALAAASALDRYLGRERDGETGLLQLGTRYYAPSLGRFISPDWYVLENPSKPGRLPQAFNVYSYAVNNPLIFKDPSGMWFFIALAAAFVIGFLVGTIYGLIKGQGWGSLLTGLETGLLAAGGFALGAGAGGVAGAGLTAAGLGPTAMTMAGIGGAMGGLNGILSGMHGIYDWEHPGGWRAFLADSTWGLLGTSIGNFVQIFNIISGAKYRDDLSRRQNRNVYEGGFYLAKNDAFTQGNVISNAAAGGSSIDMGLINNHESLHILQNRIFGPIFQVVYVTWAVGGLIVGSVFWLFNTDHSYGSLVETAAYFDNPWEYWAYSNQGIWPPAGQPGFDPIIAWG
jgi:RHS repeat-associated protein